MTPAPAVGVVDKRSDPVASPEPRKDLLTPLPAAEFPRSAPLPGSESLSTQPQPLYPGALPQAGGATQQLASWQWGIAIAGGAVFLYNTSLVIFITLFLVNGTSFSFPPGQFLTDLALAGLGGCGVMWALQDRKAALTFLVGGITLRSLIRVLAMIFTGPSAALLFEWLIVGIAGAAGLWWIWQKTPRETGDGNRLSIALSALIGAEIMTVIYGIAVRPAYMRSLDLFAAAIVTGALVWLRLKLPGTLGPAAAGGAISAGIDPRFRRALLIVAYILIAVILRVLIRTAFR